MNYNERVDALLDDLSVFDDWQERYEFIIALGHRLPAMPEIYRRDENLIRGCQSQVWVGTELRNGQLLIHADSDSLLTKGLIAIFVRLLSGLTPQEIVAADIRRLDTSGLREHLASTRANALATMADTIRRAAATYCENPPTP